MSKWIGTLAWAWVIIIGALMITPNGVHCIACGDIGNFLMGVISIVLGAGALLVNKALVR